MSRALAAGVRVGLSSSTTKAEAEWTDAGATGREQRGRRGEGKRVPEHDSLRLSVSARPSSRRSSMLSVTLLRLWPCASQSRTRSGTRKTRRVPKFHEVGHGSARQTGNCTRVINCVVPRAQRLTSPSATCRQIRRAERSRGCRGWLACPFLVALLLRAASLRRFPHPRPIRRDPRFDQLLAHRYAFLERFQPQTLVRILGHADHCRSSKSLGPSSPIL